MYGLRNSELSIVVYFNSVIGLKRVKQCCCTLILLPKSTLNASLTTTNRFFTNDDWQRGRFENFESDHQYESNLESDVRFEIESNHEASQVPILWVRERCRISPSRFLAKCRNICDWTRLVLFCCILCCLFVVFPYCFVCHQTISQVTASEMTGCLGLPLHWLYSNFNATRGNITQIVEFFEFLC